MNRFGLYLLAGFILLVSNACSTFQSHDNLRITLPGDDAYRKGHPIQWWYWNGHLNSTDNRQFGFQMVFFSIRPNFQMAHVSIADIDKSEFHYETATKLKMPANSRGVFDLSSGTKKLIQAAGGNGIDQLQAEVDGYELDLSVKSRKPPLFYYDGEAHRYDFGGYTYYYSRPRMDAEGSITVDGETIDVTGTAWFDRQFGDLEAAIDTGWQWFSVQLDDATEIALFFFHEKAMHKENMLVVYDANGEVTSYPPSAYELIVHEHWRSQESGCRYPMNWTLKFDDKELDITPYMLDQEVRPKSNAWLTPTYWEGAANVSGDKRGKAYVELHGFCS